MKLSTVKNGILVGLAAFLVVLLIGSNLASTQVSSTSGGGFSTEALLDIGNCIDDNGLFTCQTEAGSAGPGTTNKVAKFTNTTVIDDSSITDDGSAITISSASVTVEASTTVGSDDVIIGASLGASLGVVKLYSDDEVDNWVAIGSDSIASPGRWMFDSNESQLEIRCQGGGVWFDRDDSAVGGTGNNVNLEFTWTACEPSAGVNYPVFQVKTDSDVAAKPVNGNDTVGGVIITIDPDVDGDGNGNSIIGLDLQLVDDDPSPYNKVLAITLSDAYNQGIKLPNNAASAALESTAEDGTITYCTDCNQDADCSTSGSGAFAWRINGSWTCELP